MEIVGVSALSLGLIAIGTTNGEVTSTLIQTLLERSEADLKETFSKFLALAIGLIYLGKGEQVEVIIESLKAIPEPLQAFATILVDVCAYAGTGNVLGKIQQLLSICSEHIENEPVKEETKPETKEKDKKDKKDKKGEEKETSLASNLHQADIGISLIAMNEEIGSEMALRAFCKKSYWIVSFILIIFFVSRSKYLRTKILKHIK